MKQFHLNEQQLNEVLNALQLFVAAIDAVDEDVSYNTLLQTLKRMKDEGVLVNPSRGMYALPDSSTNALNTYVNNHDRKNLVMKASADDDGSNPFMTEFHDNACHDTRAMSCHDVMNGDTTDCDGNNKTVNNHDTQLSRHVADGKEFYHMADGYTIFEMLGRWHVERHNIKLHSCNSRGEAIYWARKHQEGVAA